MLGTTLALLVGYMFAGGMGNRLRGGMVEFSSTQIARLVFAIIVAALILLATCQPDAALVAIPLTWLSCLPGHGEAMHMGRHGHSLGDDIAAMMWSGFLNVLGPTLVLAFYDFHWQALLLVGLMKPLAYEIGWRVESDTPEFETGPPIGELAFGMMWGIALVIPGLGAKGCLLAY